MALTANTASSSGARDSITYTDDPARIDLEQLLALFDVTYWAQNRTRDEIARALAHSRPVISAWEGDRLVGFARVISDLTYRATIWDVVVADTHQKHGIGREIMRLLLDHPDLRTVSVFVLLTKDRHHFYEHFGFVAERDLSMMLRR